MPKFDPTTVGRSVSKSRTTADDSGTRAGSGGVGSADANDRSDHGVPFGSGPALVVAVGVVVAVVAQAVAAAVAGAAAGLDTATLRALGLLGAVETAVAVGGTTARGGALAAGTGLVYGCVRGVTWLYFRTA